MARQKKNGWKQVETCIYQRGSSFEVRVRMAPGEREIRPAKTLDEAQDIREALYRRRRSGKRGKASPLTVGAFFDRWMKHVEDNMSPGTFVNYRLHARPFVEEFSDRPLGSITRTEAQEYANREPSRCRAVSAMFGYAFKTVEIDSNPFEKVGTYRTRGLRDKELVVLTRDEVEGPRGIVQVAERVNGAYGPTYAALVSMAAWTGMRPGELFALRWGDIVWEESRVYVRRQQRTHGGVVDYTKNKKQRKIVLPPAAERRLKDPKLTRFEGSDLVFHTARGRMFKHRTNSIYWARVRAAFWESLPEERRAVIKPDFEFYELRHFCATMMYRVPPHGMGLPAYVVAAQLGHSDNGQLVQEVYGRPEHEDALAAIDDGFRTMFV